MTTNLKPGIDYVGVTITFFCHDGQGNFIMAKRGQSARDEQGKWDIGGGLLERGDTVPSAIRREIKEEYGTDVLAHEFLGYLDVHREHQGKPTHWIALVFKVLVDKAMVKNNEPHKFDDVRWFRLDNVPENVHSQFHRIINEFRDKLAA